MTRREKLLDTMRNNPGSVRPDKLDSLLIYYGFEKRRSGKNHCVYTMGHNILTVNFHRDYVHPKSVKKVLIVLDEILESG
jgi:hypothetical protein